MINSNTTTAKIIIMMTVNGTAWRGRAQFRTNSDGRVLENEAEALMNFARRYVAALSHRSSKSRVENIRLSIVVLKDAWEGTSALILVVGIVWFLSVTREVNFVATGSVPLPLIVVMP